MPPPPRAGEDARDSTSSAHEVPDLAAGLLGADRLASAPLAGRRVGLIRECVGEGVQPEVEAAVRGAARHLEALGAVVEDVSVLGLGQAGEGGAPCICVRACDGRAACMQRAA